MLNITGYPTAEQVRGAFPDDERLGKGPAAIIECFQNIPCDPCQKACKTGAILPFKDINDLPEVDLEKCNGCALCVALCPGLAIMVVDMNYSPAQCLIRLPYEFNPPEKGSKVVAVDRAGKDVCCAEVHSVRLGKNKTHIVTLIIDKEYVYDVRNFRESRTSAHGGGLLAGVDNAENPAILCRCNDITLDKVKEYIGQGFTSVNEIKRVSRLGMGACQGRNCVPLVITELSRALGKNPAELSPGNYRPVTRSVTLEQLAGYGDLS